MYTDPIADLLTRIRNADHANHEDLVAPHSVIKESILKVMKKYGFIEEFTVKNNGLKKEIEIKLKEERKGLTLNRISKSGQRIYVKSNEIRRIKSGLGIQIISTPKGIISNVEAMKAKVGGEIICEIY